MAESVKEQIRGKRIWMSWKYTIPKWYGKNCISKAREEFQKKKIACCQMKIKHNAPGQNVKAGDSFLIISASPAQEEIVRRIMMAVRPDKKEKEKAF